MLDDPARPGGSVARSAAGPSPWAKARGFRQLLPFLSVLRIEEHERAEDEDEPERDEAAANEQRGSGAEYGAEPGGSGRREIGL